MKTRKAMRKEIIENTMEMLDAAEFKHVTGYNRKEAHIGLEIMCLINLLLFLYYFCRFLYGFCTVFIRFLFDLLSFLEIYIFM